MAIYYLSMKSIGRRGGRSATAAAAYRSAELVQDHTTGQVFNYTRRQGVEHAEIVLPTDAARRDIHWARDRQVLWNAAEQAEKRIDARVAREYEIALPHELSKAQRLELVREFSATIADRYGCAVDFAIHAPPREGDERNYHAHVLTTTRKVEAIGLGAKTEIELSNDERLRRGLSSTREELVEVRALWAGMANEHLQVQGLEARIDHRSLEAQGIERQPTTHLGLAVSSMQRRGLETEVGRRLELEATEWRERVAEIGRLQREGQDLERSILALSTDVAGLLKERDRQLVLGHDLVAEERRGKVIEAASPAVDMDAARHDAALRWKSHRESQALEHDTQGRSKTLNHDLDHIQSQDAESVRQAAAERWREYRHTHSLDQGQSIEPPEDRDKTQTHDQGLDATGDE